MIDPSIYKVYKEHQKVFIPEFGAIIYSETTDSANFNELLTFDDGKVIEAIREKQKITEDEARQALNDHIAQVKAKLEEGNPHLIRGLGYLYKDDHGSYSIQKKKPITETDTPEKTAQEDATDTFDQTDTDTINTLDLNPSTEAVPTSSDLQADEQNSSPSEIEDDSDSVIVEDGHKAQEESLNEELVAQEETASDSTLSTTKEDESEHENDEAEEPRFYSESSYQENRTGEFYEEEEYTYQKSRKRKNRTIITLTALVILLFVSSTIFYFFIFHAQDKPMSTEENASQESAQLSSAMSTAKENMQLSTSQAPSGNTTTGVRQGSAGDGAGTASKHGEPSYVPSASRASTTARDYSLILGSFKVEDNATRFRKLLEQRGMEASIFRRGNAFHFVGIEEIPGKSNALQLLSKAREDEPTAWIIRKK